MSLYTKCPACGAEIAFEPPANMASLPDDYKHRIKCPACGVTIGVKLNKIDAAAYDDDRYDYEDEYDDYNDLDLDEQDEELSSSLNDNSVNFGRDRSDKKNGTSRNICLMIFSVIVIALHALGYLVSHGTLSLGNSTGYGLTYFSGINAWEFVIKNSAELSALLQNDLTNGLSILASLLLFSFAGTTFIVAFISACGKKYSRAFNFIWGIVNYILAIAVFFLPGASYASAMDEEMSGILGYFYDAIVTSSYAMFLIPILGFIHFLLSLCFLKSMDKRKAAKISTNGCAIAGFVLTFIIPPLGLILSIIGAAKAKKHGSGKGLAVAGIVINILMLLHIIIVSVVGMQIAMQLQESTTEAIVALI